MPETRDASDPWSMTPDERIAANFCPECCMDLTNLAVQQHSTLHWPNTLLPNGQNSAALHRQELLAGYTSPATTRATKSPPPSSPATPVFAGKKD